MVGRTEEFESLEIRDFSDAEVVLEAKGLRSTDSPKPKSFYLKKGELLGWYGLVEAGVQNLPDAYWYDHAIEESRL